MAGEILPQSTSVAVVEFFDMDLSERIKSHAIELGFDLVGIAPAGVAPHAKEYADWIAAGYAGEMAYMTRDPDRRSDLRRVLPGAQSVIVVGLSYYTLELPDEVKNDPSRGLDCALCVGRGLSRFDDATFAGVGGVC